VGGGAARVRILVTGGGGFIGGAVVRQLVARCDRVRSLSRGDYPELAARGVEVRRGDLADQEAVAAAAEGCDAVVHVAAKAGVWGRWEDYHRPNVVGTETVLAACRAQGVPRLVFTSSPSVVHGGGDLEGVDESLPYPTRYSTHYPATKALAEQAVLAADGDGLSTVALRPHLVWGPGDNHLLPGLVARARAGRLALPGRGDNLVDTTWIEDAAAAHLLALDRLEPGAPCAGRAYFISQGEPWPLRRMVVGLLEAAGAPAEPRQVPVWAGLALGGILEVAWAAARRPTEPPLTRFLVRQLSTAHWYDIGAARRDLGYEPSVTVEEGLRRLASELSE